MDLIPLKLITWEDLIPLKLITLEDLIPLKLITREDLIPLKLITWEDLIPLKLITLDDLIPLKLIFLPGFSHSFKSSIIFNQLFWELKKILFTLPSSILSVKLSGGSLLCSKNLLDSVKQQDMRVIGCNNKRKRWQIKSSILII